MVESTFTAMKDRDYALLFSQLSGASRSEIVDETRNAIAERGGEKLPAGAVERDFRQGGPIAKAYWEGFLRHFDPDTALAQSRWAMGEVKGDEARVLITHEGANRPAVIRLHRENGVWKVGLRETFRHQPVH